MNKLSSGSDEEKNYDDLIGIPTPNAPGAVISKSKKNKKKILAFSDDEEEVIHSASASSGEDKNDTVLSDEGNIDMDSVADAS